MEAVFAPTQLFSHQWIPTSLQILQMAAAVMVVLAPRSLAVRKRKPRRLRQEGAVGVAVMISDTRGLWHADTTRSAAARPFGAKSATGVLGLILTRWRLVKRHKKKKVKKVKGKKVRGKSKSKGRRKGQGV